MASFSESLKKLQPVEDDTKPQGRFLISPSTSASRFSNAITTNINSIPEVPVGDPSMPPDSQAMRELEQWRITRRAFEELSIFERAGSRISSAVDSIWQPGLGIPKSEEFSKLPSGLQSALQAIAVPLDQFMRLATSATTAGTTVLEETLVSFGMKRKDATGITAQVLDLSSVAGAGLATAPLGALRFRNQRPWNATPSESQALADSIINDVKTLPEGVRPTTSPIVGGTVKEIADRTLARQGDLLSELLAEDRSNVDLLIKNYMSQFDKVDPDGNIYPDDIRKSMIESYQTRLESVKPGLMRQVGQNDTIVENIRLGQQAEIDELHRITGSKIIRRLGVEFIDRNLPVKKKLLDEAGDAGREAVMKFELAAGAPSRAILLFNDAQKRIFGGVVQDRLSGRDKELIDRFVEDRRMLQIFSYRPDYKGPELESPDGKLMATREAYEADLVRLKSDIGDTKFEELNNRTTLYFDTMRQQVARLRENGLLSSGEFEKLIRFQYSPMEFLENIDPMEEIVLNRGGKISVRSSGIEALGEGTGALRIRDSEFLLAQVIARTEGRIAKNSAAQALGDAARTNSIPGILGLKKKSVDSPTGISYMVDGKRKTVWLNSDMAQFWVRTNPELSRVTSNLLGWGSGATPVRYLATGANPAFGVVNFVRDSQTLLFFSDQYSNFLPMSIAQLGRDTLAVTRDAIRREGRFNDYIMEGGGMSFLTHGAKDTSGSLPHINRDLEAGNKVLTYVGETGELIMRLAHRERALRNGMSPEEATWTARRFIDFSQGGRTSKILDVFMPYLNAGIQGIRQGVRFIKENPGAATIRVGQLTAATSGLWFYNQLNYPEVMQSVPEKEQAGNWIFPLGMSGIDAQGQKRYAYLRLPVPQMLSPIKAGTDALLSTVYKGHTPTAEIKAGLAAAGGIFDPTLTIPPTGKALAEYVSNFDFYTQQKIWKGMDGIPPSQEFNSFPDRPTSPLAVFLTQSLAQMGLEVSPSRLNTASRAVVPSNPYLEIFSQSFDYLQRRTLVPEEFRYIQGEQADLMVFLKNAPVIGRLIGVTHPLANVMDTTEEIASEQRGDVQSMNRILDSLTFEYINESGGKKTSKQAEIQSFISGLAPEYKAYAEDRFRRTLEVDAAFQPFENRTDVPGKKWWVITSGYAPVARAEVLYERWLAADSEARQGMVSIVKRMPSYWTPETRVLFNRLRAERGE